MKYCPNCGNQLKEGQSFCNKCGTHVKQSNQNHTSQSSRNYPNYNAHKQPNDKKPIGLIILLSIIFILLIAAVLYGAYYAYDHYVKNDNATSETSKSTQSDNSDSKNKGDSASKGPNIDIFSSDFDSGYMKSASTNGYHGVYKGMTRKEVEDKFGKSDGHVESSKYNYETYGDLAVSYEDNEVIQVGVSPRNVSEDQFIQTYNEPDERQSNQLIYDSNKDNDFSVLVNVKDGKVSVIENVNQI